MGSCLSTDSTASSSNSLYIVGLTCPSVTGSSKILCFDEPFRVLSPSVEGFNLMRILSIGPQDDNRYHQTSAKEGQIKGKHGLALKSSDEPLRYSLNEFNIFSTNTGR